MDTDRELMLTDDGAQRVGVIKMRRGQRSEWMKDKKDKEEGGVHLDRRWGRLVRRGGQWRSGPRQE